MATIFDGEPAVAQREASQWLGKQLTWERRLAELRVAASVPSPPLPATRAATADAA